MNKHNNNLLTSAAVACMLALGGAGLPAHAQQISNAEFLTNVNIEVYPIAYLEFDDDTPLLYLEVPPGDSTIPSSGVGFTVSGNAIATLIAEPDAFIETAGSEQWLGKAVMGIEAIGYNIELRFPNSGAPGSGVQIATLPGFEAGPTEPPLSVDLTATGGERTGVLHMEAHHSWTADGGLPLPGLYEGHVVLTLTADN